MRGSMLMNLMVVRLNYRRASLESQILMVMARKHILMPFNQGLFGMVLLSQEILVDWMDTLEGACRGSFCMD